jgi:hypothetical protein
VPPLSAAACKAQVEELKEWTGKLLEEGGFVVLVPEIQPPSLDEKPNGWWGIEVPTLHVGQSQAILDGRLVGSTRELARGVVNDDLREALDKARTAVPVVGDVGTSLALVVSPEVAWSAIATVSGALIEANLDTVVFLFRAKSELKPTENEGAKSGAPFTHCPEVPKAIMSRMGTDAIGPREKMKLFAEKIPQGMLACSCRVSSNEVKALLWGA